jgi:hypothetical protein
MLEVAVITLTHALMDHSNNRLDQIIGGGDEDGYLFVIESLKSLFLPPCMPKFVRWTGSYTSLVPACSLHTKADASTAYETSIQ